MHNSRPRPCCAALRRCGLVAALAAGLVACASGPPPTAEMAVAEAAVQRASTTSTSDNAPAQLQLAADKLASARQALANGETVRARRMAEQAQVDAEVAEMHAQAVRSRKAAVESNQAARALRDELARRSGR